MIPTSYEEWRHCIQHVCRIPLTAEFVEMRVRELGDPRLHSTAQFLRHYGPEHHSRVLDWFRQAGQRLQNGTDA